MAKKNENKKDPPKNTQTAGPETLSPFINNQFIGMHPTATPEKAPVRMTIPDMVCPFCGQIVDGVLYRVFANPSGFGGAAGVIACRHCKKVLGGTPLLN